MELDTVLELVHQVAVDDTTADRATLETAVDALRRLRGWCDHRELVLAGRLTAGTTAPDRVVARAARVSPRDATRVLDRIDTVETLSVFADALADGTLSGAHVDVIGRALRRVDPDRRPGLVDAADQLVDVATRTDPDRFARAVTATLRHLDGDSGISNLERQRRATRLHRWVDPTDGMWCLSGRFDPHTGVRLDARLHAMVDTLFTDHQPDTCPTNPNHKQDHLRALALIALTEGRGPTPGRPELVVVIDTTTTDPHSGPVIDWGLPVELPHQLLVELYPTAAIHPVITGNGIVLHTPGILDLERTTRLASRAQRRALRAWYPTCAIPDCPARFNTCKIHHVHWWEHGGPTNLDNLLPLCTRHHHAVHDTGWQLTLTPNRTLTITHPNGTTMTTGPPKRTTA